MKFKAGAMPTLLATDLAARGIHVKNIEYVINYDFPGSLDQVRCVNVVHIDTCCPVLIRVSYHHVTVRA